MSRVVVQGVYACVKEREREIWDILAPVRSVSSLNEEVLKRCDICTARVLRESPHNLTVTQPRERVRSSTLPHSYRSEVCWGDQRSRCDAHSRMHYRTWSTLICVMSNETRTNKLTACCEIPELKGLSRTQDFSSHSVRLNQL